MKGMIFNIQRFSLFDGPGIRTVVFLKGCPLRCQWCHNPEGLEYRPQVMYVLEKCIGCGACIEMCPQKCHKISNNYHEYFSETCNGCGKCTKECYTGALSLAGQEMTVEEIMNEVVKDRAFFQESGGGITLSGGEPFYQSEFAICLLKAAKEEGISTCVETSGFVKQEVLRKAAEYIDWFYYDYKSTGEELHEQLCGVPQKPILDNLTLLDEMGSKIVLRCPIIPGKNDCEKHYEGIIRVALEHTSVKEIHLEPYHKLGEHKAVQLGKAATYTGETPDQQKLEQLCEKISAECGKLCKIS